jgi:hypothetical protein
MLNLDFDSWLLTLGVKFRDFGRDFVIEALGRCFLQTLESGS